MNYLSLQQELELGRAIQKVYEGELKDKPLVREDATPEERAAAKDALDKLVNNNLKLVYDRANRYKRRFPGSLPIEDLIQEGMAGLMKSAYKYDPDRGYKFSTMAVSWIDQSMVRASNNTTRLVRLPENRLLQLTKINTLRDKLVEEGYSEEEAKAKVLEEMDITKEYYDSMISSSLFSISLNKTISTDGTNTKELIDFLDEKHAAGAVDELTMKSEAMKVLSLALSELTDLQRDVISASFDLQLDDADFKPKDIKDMFNLNNKEYNDILHDGINALRRNLSSSGFNFDDFFSERH